MSGCTGCWQYVVFVSNIATAAEEISGHRVCGADAVAEDDCFYVLVVVVVVVVVVIVVVAVVVVVVNAVVDVDVGVIDVVIVSM